jgi:hypothetical protein
MRHYRELERHCAVSAALDIASDRLRAKVHRGRDIVSNEELADALLAPQHGY